MRPFGRSGYLHKERWFGSRIGANVGSTERAISVVGALALALWGRQRRANRHLTTLASGFLLRRGLSGICPLYRRFGWSST